MKNFILALFLFVIGANIHAQAYMTHIKMDGSFYIIDMESGDTVIKVFSSDSVKFFGPVIGVDSIKFADGTWFDGVINFPDPVEPLYPACSQYSEEPEGDVQLCNGSTFACSEDFVSTSTFHWDASVLSLWNYPTCYLMANLNRESPFFRTYLRDLDYDVWDLNLKKGFFQVDIDVDDIGSSLFSMVDRTEQGWIQLYQTDAVTYNEAEILLKTKDTRSFEVTLLENDIGVSSKSQIGLDSTEFYVVIENTDIAQFKGDSSTFYNKVVSSATITTEYQLVNKKYIEDNTVNMVNGVMQLEVGTAPASPNYGDFYLGGDGNLHLYTNGAWHTLDMTTE